MICGRFTLIVICSALTANLVDNNNNIGWATESSVTEISTAQPLFTRVIAGQSKVCSNQITSHLNRAIQSKNFASDYQTIYSASIDSSADTNDLNPTAQKINKLWFIAAMVVTSSLSLFLLRILFQRPIPKPKPETVKKLAAVSESPKLPELEVNAPPGSTTVAVPSTIPPPQANSSQRSKVVNTERLTQPCAEQLPTSDSLIVINSEENYIDVVAELIQDLQQGDRNIRRKAIWELAKLGDSRVMEPLMAIMPQASSVDKSLIIKAIKQITHRSVKPVNKRLFALLNDQNPQVRVNAILDLANFYQFVIPVTQRLEQMQFDENLEVKLEAIKALNNLTQGYAVALHQDHAENQVSEVTVRDKDQTS